MRKGYYGKSWPDNPQFRKDSIKPARRPKRDEKFPPRPAKKWHKLRQVKEGSQHIAEKKVRQKLGIFAHEIPDRDNNVNSRLTVHPMFHPILVDNAVDNQNRHRTHLMIRIRNAGFSRLTADLQHRSDHEFPFLP